MRQEKKVFIFSQAKQVSALTSIQWVSTKTLCFPSLKQTTSIRIVALCAILGGSLLFYHKYPDSWGKALAFMTCTVLIYKLVIFACTPLIVASEKKLLFQSSLCKAYLISDPSEDNQYKKRPSLCLDQDEHHVRHCLASENHFLYTRDLASCIGITAICKLQDNSVLIGVAHLSGDDLGMDWICESQIFQQGFNPVEMVKQGHFKPRILSQLIGEIRKHSLYKNEEIQLTLSGGRGSRFCEQISRLYHAYIENHANMIVVGKFLNPFESTQKIDEMLIGAGTSGKFLNVSITAGITPQGEVVFKKNREISFNRNMRQAKAYFTWYGVKMSAFLSS